MARITEIRPQIKDKGRCSVYLDGRFCCGLTLEAVVGHRLKVGDEVSSERLAEIQAESERQTALDKALTHLSASMKTSASVRTYLQKKGYLPPVVDYVLEKLKEYGFVDDAEYARRYAGDAAKRKGKRLIALELRRKGVEEEKIASAVDALGGEEDAARAVFEKYMRGKPPTRETLAKAYRHLLSKGFGHDAAKDALASLREEDEGEEG